MRYTRRMATLLAYEVDEAEGLAPARFTAERFLAMCDMGAFGDDKVELVDGEIFTVSPPGWTHARLQVRLSVLLESALAGTGMLTGAETGSILGPSTVRGFDVVVVRSDPGPGRLDPAIVALAVEIADTTLERDLVIKAREYAVAGIPHYWVVDVRSRTVHAMSRPGKLGYNHNIEIGFDEPLPVPGTDRTITLG